MGGKCRDRIRLGMIGGQRQLSTDLFETQKDLNEPALMAELVEALRITREKLLSIAHSEFDGVWSDQDFLNEVAEADAALAKIKEQTK